MRMNEFRKHEQNLCVIFGETLEIFVSLVVCILASLWCAVGIAKLDNVYMPAAYITNSATIISGSRFVDGDIALNEILSGDRYTLNRESNIGDGRIIDISIIDNHLIVATVDKLKVINITDLSAITEVSSIDIDGIIRGVETNGSIAYVLAYPGGVRAVDLSVWSRPVIIDSYNVGEDPSGNGSPAAMTISDKVAYLAQYGDTLHVVDISNKDKMIGISKIYLEQNSGTIKDVEYINGVVYVVSSLFVYIIDVSDLKSPKLISRIQATGSRVWSGISVSGTTAYVGATTAGVVVWDVSNPNMPQELKTINPPVKNGAFRRPVVINRALFIPAGEAGMLIFDLSSENEPRLVNQIDTTGDASKIIAGIDTIILSEQDNGLSIYKYINNNVTFIRNTNPYYNIYDVDINNNTMYGLSTPGNMITWDINSPSTPIRLSETQIDPRGLADMSFTPNGIVTIRYSGTVVIIDITDVNQPRVAKEIVIPGNRIRSLSTWGDFAYVLTEDIFYILKIDLTNSQVIGKISLNDAYASIAGDGSSVYMANEDNILVVDVVNKELPQIVGTLIINDIGGITDMEISEENLIVGGARGVMFVDISRSNAPRVRFRDQRSTQVTAMSRSGDLVYVANERDLVPEITIWDVADPDSPTIVGRGELTFMYGSSQQSYVVSGLTTTVDIIAAAVGSRVLIWRLVDVETRVTQSPPLPTQSPTKRPSPTSAKTALDVRDHLYIPRLSRRQ